MSPYNLLVARIQGSRPLAPYPLAAKYIVPLPPPEVYLSGLDAETSGALHVYWVHKDGWNDRNQSVVKWRPVEGFPRLLAYPVVRLLFRDRGVPNLHLKDSIKNTCGLSVCCNPDHWDRRSPAEVAAARDANKGVQLRKSQFMMEYEAALLSGKPR